MLMELIETCKSLMMRWRRKEPPPPPIVEEYVRVERPALVATPSRAAHETDKTLDDCGPRDYTPYHLDDLLKSLPSARQLLGRLEKNAPDEYEYFSRVGARLLSPDAVAGLYVIEDRVMRRLPGKGCVYIPAHESADRMPKFMMFTKVKPPAHYADLPAVAFYRFHFAAGLPLANRRLHSKIFAYDVLCAIGKDGVARALPEVQQEYYALPTSKANPMVREMGPKIMQRPYIGFPFPLEMHYQDHLKTYSNALPKDKWIATLMHLAINFYATTSDGLQVRATKHKKTITFSVGKNDAAVFFKDRATGAKRRIFHFVDEHTRVRKGKKVVVSAHYRGLRSFQWKGEAIYISPPEQSDTHWDGTAIEVALDAPVEPGYLLNDAAGDLVRDATQRPFKVRKGQFINLPSNTAS